MKNEIELRILSINIAELTEKIKALGAELVASSLQRRYVYDVNPVQKGKWVRLRTNGDTTTLCVKEVISQTAIDGVKEIEVIVDNFEKGVEYRRVAEIATLP